MLGSLWSTWDPRCAHVVKRSQPFEELGRAGSQQASVLDILLLSLDDGVAAGPTTCAHVKGRHTHVHTAPACCPAAVLQAIVPPVEQLEAAVAEVQHFGEGAGSSSETVADAGIHGPEAAAGR